MTDYSNPLRGILPKAVHKDDVDEAALVELIERLPGEVEFDAYVKAFMSMPEVAERTNQLENCLQRLANTVWASGLMDKGSGLRAATEEAALVLENRLEVGDVVNRIKKRVSARTRPSQDDLQVIKPSRASASNSDNWENLEGGYRARFDPRPQLRNLEIGKDVRQAWHELWEELHHQGDVGVASYAAVPQIVRIYKSRDYRSGWDTFAIVATIELARDNPQNPAVPKWLEEDYFEAIRDLGTIAAVQILRSTDLEESRAILSILALSRGARTHARFLLNYSGEELLEMERRL